MALFFTCFIVFLIWFRVKIKQNKSTLSDANNEFWEREKRANFARKQDISSLEYVIPDLNRLPFSQSPNEQEQELINEVKTYSAGKMINLSSFSNTDLKEQYGIANLDELTEYDQRFLLFIRALSAWANYLYEKEDFERAKQIMEYSIEIGSDISTMYTNLGNIYMKLGTPDKIDHLIRQVENSEFALKESMLKKLRLCKLEN